MPSATQPDEVVEVFLGDTLEDAMSRAVARLGPDLTVRRARKVRKGVQGLVGKDRFEVVAVPPQQGGVQAVEGAFEALLMQAEQAEDPVVRRAARAQEQAEAEEPLLRVVPPRPAPEAEVIRPASLPLPVELREVVPDVVPARRVPRQASTTRTRPVRARTAPLQRAEPVGWGAEALRQLGLPRALLSRLPAREPRTDAQWIAALTRAFAAVVPAAHAPSAEHPVVVDGYGIEGVRGILAAAAKGLTPGRIHYSGRSALATPTELALAVRAEVHR